MKISCEFCGTVIDTEVDQTCPKCDAEYGSNESFIEHKDILMEKQKLENRKCKNIENIQKTFR